MISLITALLVQPLLAAVPGDALTKMLVQLSSQYNILKNLSDRDLTSLKSVSNTLDHVVSTYVYYYRDLKLCRDLSRQYIQNPESLKDYINKTIENKNKQLHLKFGSMEYIQLDRILEGEYAAITMGLFPGLWRNVDSVKQIITNAEAKNKQLYLEFTVGNKADVLAAYGVINNLPSDVNVILVGSMKSEELDLENSQITDLKPLSGLVELKQLNLGNTPVEDLSPLSGLVELEELYLGNTQVTNLTPLSGLVNLKTLSLFSTPVTDLKPLRGLVELVSLDLYNTQVVDITPLSGLFELQSLFLGNTPVASDPTLEAQIAELKSNIPGLGSVST
jgi:Leucine-rich repeat (LRR) protein